MAHLKKLRAAFFCTAIGREPVREWLRSLSRDERRRVGQDIATAEYGWPVGMPVCRALGGGLFEIRSELGSGSIARVIFCIAGGCIVLLHGFIKKTQRTPRGDLLLAAKRRKDLTP